VNESSSTTFGRPCCAGSLAPVAKAWRSSKLSLVPALRLMLTWERWRSGAPRAERSGSRRSCYTPRRPARRGRLCRARSAAGHGCACRLGCSGRRRTLALRRRVHHRERLQPATGYQRGSSSRPCRPLWQAQRSKCLRALREPTSAGATARLTFRDPAAAQAACDALHGSVLPAPRGGRLGATAAHAPRRPRGRSAALSPVQRRWQPTWPSPGRWAQAWARRRSSF